MNTPKNHHNHNYYHNFPLNNYNLFLQKNHRNHNYYYNLLGNYMFLLLLEIQYLRNKFYKQNNKHLYNHKNRE